MTKIPYPIGLNKNTAGRIDPNPDTKIVDLIDNPGLTARYSQSFERVAARLRESRQITDAIATELGDAAIQGKQGRLLVEMTRTLVFDLLMKLQDEETELETKDVMMLGKGLSELGKALRHDQDYETKLREVIAEEERKKAADIVEQAASKAGKGLSRSAVDAIKAEILGVG